MQSIESGIFATPPIVKTSLHRVRSRTVSSRRKRAKPVDGAKDPVRIVIVEDDYLIACEMELALTEAGFAVAGVVGSVEETLELAGTTRLALAVMDIHLSGTRDGIDAALELFARHGIRCIFTTAHHTAETRARAEPAKPLAWVPKPYSMPTLVEIVRRAVRESGESRR